MSNSTRTRICARGFLLRPNGEYRKLEADEVTGPHLALSLADGMSFEPSTFIGPVTVHKLACTAMVKLLRQNSELVVVADEWSANKGWPISLWSDPSCPVHGNMIIMRHDRQTFIIGTASLVPGTGIVATKKRRRTVVDEDGVASKRVCVDSTSPKIA